MGLKMFKGANSLSNFLWNTSKVYSAKKNYSTLHPYLRWFLLGTSFSSWHLPYKLLEADTVAGNAALTGAGKLLRLRIGLVLLYFIRRIYTVLTIKENFY